MDIQYVSQSTGLYTPIHFGPLLGRGAFGSTYELFNNSRNPTGFACKEVIVGANPGMEMTYRDSLRKTINEIAALETMGLLEGYTRKGDTFYIVMKKVEGHKQYLSPWNMSDVHGSFNALRDCHRKNITHFDSHSGNFLTNSKTKKTTAIDFGLSRDASFVNIFLDSFLFILINKVVANFGKIPQTGLFLFVQDYLTYARENKLEALTNIAWWGGLVYGAIYGIPALMLPNHFFYDYLKSKLLFQAFLELRGLGLVKQQFAELFISPFMNDHLKFFIHRCNLDIIFKHIFKPFYLVSLFIPYTMFKNFYEANTELVKKAWGFIKNLTRDNLKTNVNDIISNNTLICNITETISNSPLTNNFDYETGKKTLENFYELMTKENIKSVIDATATQTVFQAALLYHPIKAGLKFVDDAVLNPLQPECVAKARADLYFKYRPALYAKAAVSTVCNAASSLMNCFKPNKAAYL